MSFHAFQIPRGMPGEVHRYAGHWCAQRMSDGHIMDTKIGATKTEAMQKVGAPLKEYHVEAAVRIAGTTDAYQMAVFMNVPLLRMTSEAATDGINTISEKPLDILRIRTIWSIDND